MNNFGRLLRTVIHLKLTQVVFQVARRMKHQNQQRKACFSAAWNIETFPAAKSNTTSREDLLKTCPISRYRSLEGERFSFLNLQHTFTDWNYTENGALFTYNQNYFDWLNQKGMSAEEGCCWIDRFIADLPTVTHGLDPYPTAVRGINWVKFFCRHPETITKERTENLLRQYRLLQKTLEYHLLGNHLLEDFFALYIMSWFLGDESYHTKVTKRLIRELEEETLQDGGHFEQSPMYHCILLDRLLDCLNADSHPTLVEMAQRWLGWLGNICYKDGTFPLFNDAALGIAPTPHEIFAYAERMGIEADAVPLSESGYRTFGNDTMEAVIDCGNITATYQPGHTHADALTYELRIDGHPIVVDTGTSTYDKTPRRDYERSTAAHNCVTIDGRDSSETWGGFRVGYRHQMRIIKDKPNEVEACVTGFGGGLCHKRHFIMTKEGFAVEDEIPYGHEGISYIHLAPGIATDRIKIEGATHIEIHKGQMSTEYNRFTDIDIICIHFQGRCRYIIPKA